MLIVFIALVTVQYDDWFSCLLPIRLNASEGRINLLLSLCLMYLTEHLTHCRYSVNGCKVNETHLHLLISSHQNFLNRKSGGGIIERFILVLT